MLHPKYFACFYFYYGTALKVASKASLCLENQELRDFEYNHTRSGESKPVLASSARKEG